MAGAFSQKRAINSEVFPGSLFRPTLSLMMLSVILSNITDSIIRKAINVFWKRSTIHADNTTLFSECGQAFDLRKQLHSEPYFDLQDIVYWDRN